MDVLWPSFLLLLGLIPLIAIIYIWVLQRRKRLTVRYSSLSLVREALPRQSWLRRHLPVILFLLALSSLVFAMSRPVAVVSVPSGEATIILAIDVSRSMCSTDISPNRLRAAQDAAISFIRSQSPNSQIGLVAFAGYAELVLVPSIDPEMLEDSVESLLTGRRTAIGSAILKSLEAIAEIDKSVAPIVRGPSVDPAPTPVARGAYAPAIIVVLTDGASNAGTPPLDAAQQAADRGVRVYTIGFGTDEGGEMICGDGSFSGFSGGGGSSRPIPDGGGFPGGGGGGFRRGIDEVTLQQVSELTDGEYYSAESAGELEEVFNNLPTYLITRHETTEISVLFVVAGALLTGLALALALFWRPYP